MLGLAVVVSGLGLAAEPSPAPAQVQSPTLKLLKVRLSKPAVVGRQTSIVVEAVDPMAPVSGMVLQFGRKRDVFGTSACGPPDASSVVPHPFRPGARTRLSAPHRFRKRGRQKVLVRVDSGGCTTPVTSVYQTVTVTTAQKNERPEPPTSESPSLLRPPGSLLPPILPARPLSDRGVPTLPGILPGLPVADARKRRGCKGSGMSLGTSRRARVVARRALLCLLNRTRRRYQLHTLRANRQLLRAAERHSLSMVQQHFFAHVEPSGLSPLQRILNAGYQPGADGFIYGENIGFGAGPTSSPRSMMSAWMHSSPHRANILTSSFREVGLGIVPGIPGRAGARGGTYTTVFGLRR